MKEAQRILKAIVEAFFMVYPSQVHLSPIMCGFGDIGEDMHI